MLNGVNGNGPVEGKSYTMQSLNIQSGTRTASIFHEIDMSDGVEDNSLTQKQVREFKETSSGKKLEGDNVKTNKKDENKFAQSSYKDILTAYFPELVEKHGLNKAMRMFKDAAGIDSKSVDLDPNLKIPEEIDGVKRNKDGDKALEELKQNNLNFLQKLKQGVQQISLEHKTKD